jgi:hypothetical protein
MGSLHAVFFLVNKIRKVKLETGCTRKVCPICIVKETKM